MQQPRRKWRGDSGRKLTGTIKKRAVFYIGGYDPKSPDAFYTRLNRELERFQTVWGTAVKQSTTRSHGDDVTIGRFHTAGPTWTCETDFHFLTLDDIVLKDFKQPFWKRLGRSLRTSADYIFSGTAFALFRHAWRFFLYFAYPVAMPFVSIIISLAIAMMVATSGIAFASLASIVTFLAILAIFVQVVWKRYYVLHLMDLWSFSRDFIHQSRSDIETKLDNFAALIAKASKEQAYDEIILIGHSTGGALMLDAAGRAVEKYEELGNKHARVSVLTIGSTALKIGLHPAAGWFRDRSKRLFANPKIRWVEYQCLTDIINLFRTDPARLMGQELSPDEDGRPRPQLGEIRIREMVSAETYKRIKSNFFRVHYQFVFGNTKKYHYDFMGICFGPASLSDRARNPKRFAISLTGSENKKND